MNTDVEFMLWYAVALLFCGFVVQLFVIALLMRRVGKLEILTQPLRTYTEFDHLMDEFSGEREYDNRAWRRERGLMDVPGMLAEALAAGPVVLGDPVRYDSATTWARNGNNGGEPVGTAQSVEQQADGVLELHPDKLHPSHVTRFSDASSFGEVCVNCGHTDVSGGGWGKLRLPCPNPPPAEPQDPMAELSKLIGQRDPYQK